MIIFILLFIIYENIYSQIESRGTASTQYHTEGQNITQKSHRSVLRIQIMPTNIIRMMEASFQCHISKNKSKQFEHTFNQPQIPVRKMILQPKCEYETQQSPPKTLILIKVMELQLFQNSGGFSMRIEGKEVRDQDFTPRDIRKRACYRKISEEIKNFMAKLYYVQHVKMSKLVKKYNLSFSTITDILKKYDQHGHRIAKAPPPRNPTKCQDSPPASLKQETTNEVKIEFADPLLLQELESPHNPEYVFYEN